ncbi:hypothetical protein ABPG74_000931 [Tetrahymena malaccensis]
MEQNQEEQSNKPQKKVQKRGQPPKNNNFTIDRGNEKSPQIEGEKRELSQILENNKQKSQQNNQRSTSKKQQLQNRSRQQKITKNRGIKERVVTNSRKQNVKK